ncbi:hypothetical protein [Enterococcus pingfangensis]
MAKMKNEAAQVKQRRIFDIVYVGVLLATVIFAYLMDRMPESSNQRLWPMLIVGVIFLFSIARFFIVIPKSSAISGRYAPLIIPKTFGFGWAINPYNPLGKILLIGIFLAIEALIFFG